MLLHMWLQLHLDPVEPHLNPADPYVEDLRILSHGMEDSKRVRAKARGHSGARIGADGQELR